jgi:hypothetical protein
MISFVQAFQQSVDAQARESLSSGSFPWYDPATGKYSYNPPPPPGFFERLMNWLSGWIPNFSFPSPGISLGFDWVTSFIWGLVAALVIFLVYQIILVIRESIDQRKSATTPKPSAAIEISDLPEEIDVATATPDQIWAMACRMKREGQERQAISLAWLAIVRRFGARHELHDPTSLTPRQWGREAKRIHPMLQLEKLVGFYEIVIFGDRRFGHSAMESWWTGAERVYGKLEGGEMQ